MAFKKIAYTTNLADITLMRALLEDEGIEVLDTGRSGHVTIAGADIGFYVRVVDEKAHRARRLLADTEFADLLIKD